MGHGGNASVTSGERPARAMGVKFLGRIPIEPEVVACGDDGRLAVADSRGSPAMAALARAIHPITGADDHGGVHAAGGRTGRRGVA